MAHTRTFQLLPGEQVDHGIRRVVRALILDAAERLSSDVAPGAAVHGARKNFKRARSTMRLVGGSLDDKTRRRENAVIRELGQRLSGARDSQVMLETFDKLAASDGPHASSFRRHLLERREQALGAERDGLAQISEVLQDTGARIDRWEFSGAGERAMLTGGLTRIYRRGRRQGRRARKEPTAHNLHEWRKRAKDLWYGAQILEQVAPRRVHALAKRAHHLTDLLGDAHDLAVLREEVAMHARDGARQGLLERIDRRADELQSEAFARGKQLYRRRPAKFGRRLAGVR